ncbi:hypothetical protein [Rhizobium leguminosarum]|uniref:Integral membrane protein n=1 Tax=Rhizobium leguminosarum TaxID=384 RepID=A0A2Z4YT79_RHILE|nr:hypothetical protein [Rhizobium leguminosarum]AXA44269.1 hypothetical protein DLJ82_6298 [Rhizobium leguminosarum]
MKIFKTFKAALIISGAMLVGLGAVDVSTPGAFGLISPAEARVGRPMTPMSAAGVARRTVRRCAVGVYYC